MNPELEGDYSDFAAVALSKLFVLDWHGGSGRGAGRGSWAFSAPSGNWRGPRFCEPSTAANKLIFDL